MSIIGKKPFAEQVLNALSGPQISRLSSLVNNLGTPLKMDIHALTKGANEVEYVRLTFNKELAIAKEGFLCYISNDLCGFFSFQNDTDSMISYKVNPTNGAYTDMHELLTADEFRRIIDDSLEAGGLDKKEVNIITFSNVALDGNNEASLSITKAQFDIMQDTSEECLVVIEYTSGAKVQLVRTKINSSSVTFSDVHRYGTDSFEIGTANFTKVGSSYSGTYKYETKMFGTKLYEHVIDFDTGDTLYIITSSSVHFTLETLIGKSCLSFVSARVVSNNYGFGDLMSVESLGSETYIIYWFDLVEQNTEQSEEISSIEDYTVIEL